MKKYKISHGVSIAMLLVLTIATIVRAIHNDRDLIHESLTNRYVPLK
jgi:hypothetical protein